MWNWTGLFIHLLHCHSQETSLLPTICPYHPGKIQVSFTILPKNHVYFFLGQQLSLYSRVRHHTANFSIILQLSFGIFYHMGKFNVIV